MLWKNRYLILILLILLASLIFSITSRNKPLSEPVISVATPVPSAILKEIQYDSSTDLKKELDSVDPQVNDSDFSF